MLLKQPEKSRKPKKAEAPTDKSEEATRTTGSNVRLPGIATESEPDFVKHFLAKNGKPYVQPKQPKNSFAGAAPFQVPGSGASREVALPRRERWG